MKKILLILILSTPLFANSQVKDFVSDLKLGEIYTNQLSLDFVVMNTFGKEQWEQYEYCRLKGLGFDSMSTWWPNQCERQVDNRIAFLSNDNFYLMDCQIWDPIKKDRVIGPYKPYDNRYDYYIGNGFAFSDMNELLDFNEDGYLDRKIKYTTLDYEASRSVTNEKWKDMLSEYEEKIKNGEISKDVDWAEYQEKELKLNNNFGWWGYGYLTKYSDDGYLYFLQ